MKDQFLPGKWNYLTKNIHSFNGSFIQLLVRVFKDVTIKIMEAEIRRLIQEVHDSPGRVMIATAGSGTQALAWLLGVAGASRTLLEALIPYEETSFNDFLGKAPKKFVTPKTARLMAGRAVTRARQLCQGDVDVIGLACTATIITDRPKRGEHRAHVATWTLNGVTCYNLHLSKGARDRYGEEELVSRLMLNALAKAYGLETRISLPLLDSDRYNWVEDDLVGAVDRLYQEKAELCIIRADGSLQKGTNPKALLSGAFNPLHSGHLRLAETAAEILDQEVIFELTAVNADKPSLEKTETLHRVLQFAGRYPVVVSNAPTFVAKARLFPRTTFVIGYDTAERILQPRFYADSQAHMLSALAEIRERGCCFLVAGRTNSQGIFHDARGLSVPEGYHDLFKIIPAGRFRHDISSTELRTDE